MTHHPRHERRRSGFTLIEILVTIGIILLMMALLVATFGGAFGTARNKATQATIAKIDRLIADRMGALDRSIENGELRNKVHSEKQKHGDEAAAKAKVRKDMFKKAFPQTFAETTDERGKTLTPGSGHTPETESAECLYWALTQGPAFGLPPVGTDEFTVNEVKDTDGDGLLEFVDSWEHPLRFYRWPTRFIRPDGDGDAIDATDRARIDLLMQGLDAKTLDQDPDYPIPRGGFTVTESSYHTPNTYHQPLVVSGGEDETIGLREPNDAAGFGHLARPTDEVLAAPDPGDTTLNDDITNRKRLGSN